MKCDCLFGSVGRIRRMSLFMAMSVAFSGAAFSQSGASVNIPGTITVSGNEVDFTGTPDAYINFIPSKMLCKAGDTAPGGTVLFK